MSLELIKQQIDSLIEGLFYGEVEFSYDAMGFTAAFSHPAEILGDMSGELEMMIEQNMADPEELSMMLSGMKEMRFCFDLVQLNEAIEGLESYLANNK